MIEIERKFIIDKDQYKMIEDQSKVLEVEMLKNFYFDNEEMFFYDNGITLRTRGTHTQHKEPPFIREFTHTELKITTGHDSQGKRTSVEKLIRSIDDVANHFDEEVDTDTLRLMGSINVQRTYALFDGEYPIVLDKVIYQSGNIAYRELEIEDNIQECYEAIDKIMVTPLQSHKESKYIKFINDTIKKHEA